MPGHPNCPGNYYRETPTDEIDRVDTKLIRSVFEFAAGAFLHQQRYEIADLAGLEPGVLFADERVDRHGSNRRKLVNQSALDVR
jgi:hypothetical protein